MLCWINGDESEALLVARGSEEPEEVSSDSPIFDEVDLSC